MSLSDQTRSLMQSGAEWRQSVHGTKADGSPVIIEYDGGAQSPRGYFTLIRSQEQLDAMGCFKQAHDAVVRCFKTALVNPRLNKSVTVTLADETRLTLRIDEYGNNQLNPEWVMGCKSL